MIITCPSCKARYAVEASKIGPRGRTVKCAKCAHTWMQPAPSLEELEAASPASASPARSSDPAPAPSPAPAASGARERADNGGIDGGGAGEETDPVGSEREFEDFRATFDAAMQRDDARSAPAAERRDGNRRDRAHPDSGRRANLPAVRRDPSPWPARLAWLLLVAVVGGVLGGAVVLRDTIVKVWPPSQRLYDTVGLSPEPIEKRLGVRNVKYAYGSGDEAGVLTVEGEIVNISGSPTDVPDLRVLFFNNGGDILHRWVFPAPERRMLPSESVPFSTRVVSPPPEAKRIEVGFDIEDR